MDDEGFSMRQPKKSSKKRSESQVDIQSACITLTLILLTLNVPRYYVCMFLIVDYVEESLWKVLGIRDSWRWHSLLKRLLWGLPRILRLHLHSSLHG